MITSGHALAFIAALSFSALVGGLILYRRPAFLHAPVPARCREPIPRLRRALSTELQVSVTDLVRLSVRMDELWEDTSGILIPVETKTRDRLFESDIIELSACAYALRHSTGAYAGRPVSARGFVRLAPPGGLERMVSVTLLSDSQLETVLHRFVVLRFGLSPPRPSPHEFKCRACPFSQQGCDYSLACEAG